MLKSFSLLAVLFGIVLSSTLIAQSPVELSDQEIIQSPETMSFGKFGDIPVSLFNGGVGVTVPISSIQNGKIETPVYLQYDASGSRPDTHPGWVGLNWTLNAGGVIVRHVNGYADENGNGAISASYLAKYSELSSANWTAEPHLEASGTVDLSPDEFSFSVNSISGKFMLNHLGQWVVYSRSDPNMKVQHEVITDYQLLNLKGGEPMTLPRIFSKFTLTASDGTIYIFGREQAAIEFSIPALAGAAESYNHFGPVGPGNYIQYCYNSVPCIGSTRYVQASAWRLSEIVSPVGASVKFFYKHGLGLSQSNYSMIASSEPYNGITNKTYDINQTTKYLVYISYPTSIVADNKITYTFKTSVSNELPWVYYMKPQSHDNFLNYDYNSVIPEYYKLDGLDVMVNNVTVNTITFGYIENTSERLKLTRVRFHKPNYTRGDYEYAFEYNPDKLPAYCSGLEDHWGYYNGNNFYGSTRGQYVTTVPNLTDYFNSRNPNAELMDAEVLTKITYPTGGYTKFTFQPHDYSKSITLTPAISLTVNSANAIAGGLRIGKTETFDAYSTTPIVKEYFYNTSYLTGGALSSGILSGRPYYYDQVTNEYGHYSKFSSSPLNYLNTTNGNHVTYSEVTEKSNNGYTVYSYTNHDNGYLDKDPFTVKSTDTRAMVTSKLFGKLDLERGQELSVSHYASDKFLLKKVLNTYNDDPARYDNYVRACQLSGGASINNVFTFPIYTFIPYQKSVQTIEYTREGVNISRTINYEYNAKNMITNQTEMQSDGSVTRTTYRYPLDVLGNSPQQLNEPNVIQLRNLVVHNVITTPIETTTRITRDGQNYVISGSIMLFKGLLPYKILKTALLNPLPEASFSDALVLSTGVKWHDSYEEDATISKYDVRGNMEESIARDGIITSYLWGYENTYPIAKIQNASFDEVQNVLGTSTITQLYKYNSDGYIQLQINAARIALPRARVFSYTYSPLAGITSETNPNQVKLTYEYDLLNRLKSIKDTDGNVTRAVEYNYYVKKGLSTNINSVDFGLVGMNTSATRSILVTNTGNINITVTGIQAPSGYGLVDNVSIPTGETREVLIKFVPSANGSFNGVASILTLENVANSFEVKAFCENTRIMGLNATSLNFNGVRLGSQPAVRVVTITNTGDGTLSITNVTTPIGYHPNWTTASIAPGQNKVLEISFAPNKTGTLSGQVIIDSDKTSGANTFSVTGVGTP